MNSVVELGREIELAWAKHDYNEIIFPELAMERLLARDFPRTFEFEEFVEAVLYPRNPPAQLSDDFGQPVITVYSGQGGFVCEVHLWDDNPVYVHNHAFHGAFQMVRGIGIHNEAVFEPKRRVNQHLQLGFVRQTKLETVRGGAHGCFLAGESLIHQLLHVSRGNVSIVVRTRSAPDPYYHYVPPTVRLTQETHAGRYWTKRQVRLLESLYNADPTEGLRVGRKFLSETDMETAYHILHRFYEIAPVSVCATLADACSRITPSDLELILAALREDKRSRVLARLRSAAKHTRERFVYSALICSRSKRQVLDLVAAAYPSDDPARLIASIAAEGEGADLAVMFLQDRTRAEVMRELHDARSRGVDVDIDEATVVEIERAVASWFPSYPIDG